MSDFRFKLNFNHKQKRFSQKIYILPQNLKNDNFDDQTVKKIKFLPKINFIYSLFRKNKSFDHKKYYVVPQICAKTLDFCGITAIFCVRRHFVEIF
jgi:hypothetical protein